MLTFHFHSAGFLSVALDTLFLRVEPAYFFGWAGEKVKPFYSDLLRLDFRSLYVRWGAFEMGRILPKDTGNLFLDALSKGYDGASLEWEFGKLSYTYRAFKVEVWTSDGDYYFNPDAVRITKGQKIDRYVVLKSASFGDFTFSEITVLSTLAGNFPDVRAFNPLLPGYLYQWFYSKEVNVLWQAEYTFKSVTLRLIVDDFPYLPSWFSIVPPTVGMRFSGKLSPLQWDALWISAFTYANRRAWDALYESPYFGGDYAHLSVKFSGGFPFVEVGVWAKGKYNGTFKEPSIGYYPPFAFLHDPVRWDGWVSAGIKKGRYELQVGYGSKPNALNFRRFFIHFSAI